MRINTNVGALQSSRNMFVNNMSTESSMRKLSTGLRISRAADDAAGLSIANKLRTQGRSLSQATNSALQANYMMSIAEGSTQTIQRIIERQKELIMQRESTGNNSAVSATLNAEIAKLSEETTRIIASTNYQGSTIFGQNLLFQVNDGFGGNTININLSTLNLSGAAILGTASLAQADTALNLVNSVLGEIGSTQNRLDFTVENLKTAVVNLRAAESTIRDADMAEEMATFTRNQVLTQAAQAMLAQANQSTQGVLSLLR
jgi:flagellin